MKIAPIKPGKVWLLAFSLALSGSVTDAQKVLTLKECYESAANTSALAGEKQAYAGISELREANLQKGWLPTIDLNGSALYNSEVVDLSPVLGSIPVPGIANAIKPLPHDQYKLTLDVNQVIYDGGAIKVARELEKADLKVNEKQSETDIYKIRSQVNGIYFSILLANRQEELQRNFLSLLNNRIQSVESAVRNGVRMRSDADILKAEKIRVEQQLADISIRKNSMLRVLSELTGVQADSSAKLILPENIDINGDEIKRPELELFDLRQNQLDAGISMAGTKRLPKAFGFATLGYGNPPGNNFFRDQFDTYYMIGAGIKWNIFDWSKAKNEKQAISTQKKILENRKSDLTDNLRRQLDSKRAEIESLQMMAASDSELVALRKSITAASDSQYQNGTITATEYLDALNSEKQAIINSEIHRISLSMAKADYLNISGKELE